MLTRRGFIAGLAGAGAAMAAASMAPVEMCAAAARARGPVVSIHMDQPYIDPTGNAIPYHPPDGLRSAEPIARLSEVEFRSCQIYL